MVTKKGVHYAGYGSQIIRIFVKTLPAQSGSNRHTGDCPDFLLYLSVYGVDQVYPRLYSVEGNSDSTPFYFICICVENEYDPLDRVQAGGGTDYGNRGYFPAGTPQVLNTLAAPGFLSLFSSTILCPQKTFAIILDHKRLPERYPKSIKTT